MFWFPVFVKLADQFYYKSKHLDELTKNLYSLLKC